MKEVKILLSIIVPCFNEANRFNPDYWIEIIEDSPFVEWIFVDDGSKDNTFKILSNLSKLPRVSIIKLESNRGKAEAIRRGFISSQALGEIKNPDIVGVGFIDSDGAFQKYDIINILKLAVAQFTSNHEISYGAIISSRVKLGGRQIFRSASRHYIGRIIATYLCKNWSTAPYDTQSGFKVFQKTTSLARSIEKPFKTRWFFDIELFLRLYSYESNPLNVWEEPLNYWKDVIGSKIKKREYLLIIIEIVRVRKMIKKSL